MSRSVCAFIAASVYWSIAFGSLLIAACIVTWWSSGLAFATLFGGLGIVMTLGYHMPCDGTLSTPLAEFLVELYKDDDK